MNRIFGPDEALFLVAPSFPPDRNRDGRPENCPNRIVSLLRIALLRGVPLGQSLRQCTRAIARFLVAAGCSWPLFAVVAGCSWLLSFRSLSSKSQRLRGRDQTTGCFFAGLTAASARSPETSRRTYRVS